MAAPIELAEIRDIVAMLDELKTQIISGEITGLMIATEKDHAYNIITTSCDDSRRFAGTLLEMAIDRVSYSTGRF